jgi:hypothetical protein
MNPWKTKVSIRESVKNRTADSQISVKRKSQIRILWQTKFPIYEFTINETRDSLMQIKRNSDFTEQCTKLLQESSTRMAFMHVWVTETCTSCALFSQFTGNEASARRKKRTRWFSFWGAPVPHRPKSQPILQIYSTCCCSEAESGIDKLFLKASIFFSYLPTFPLF